MSTWSDAFAVVSSSTITTLVAGKFVVSFSVPSLSVPTTYARVG